MREQQNFRTVLVAEATGSLRLCDLAKPTTCLQGGGLGRDSWPRDVCRGLGFLFIWNRIVKQHGRVSPSWALCDVVRFWGGRLGEEAAQGGDRKNSSIRGFTSCASG